MAIARDTFPVEETFTLNNLIDCIKHNKIFDVAAAVDACTGKEARAIKKSIYSEEGSIYNGWSLITAAAHSGNPEAVEFLMELEADPDAKIAAGNDHTALILAAERCDDTGAKIIELLVKAGAKLDLTAGAHNAASKAIDTYLGYNSTFKGSDEGLTHTLTALCAAPAIAAAGSAGPIATPELTLSRYEGAHGNILTYNLLAIHAEMDTAGGNEAALAKAQEKMAKWQTAKEIWTSAGGSMSIGKPSVLIDAIEEVHGCNAEQATRLINAGFNPNESDCGFTPLHVAVRERQVEVVSALLAQSTTNATVKTPEGWSQFAFARGQAVSALNLADYATLDEKEAGKRERREPEMKRGAAKAWQASLEEILTILASKDIKPTRTEEAAATAESTGASAATGPRAITPFLMTGHGAGGRGTTAGLGK